MVTGRARLGQIVHHSGLSARQVKHGLFTLIQLRLAVSSLSEQDGLYSYEPCPSCAYALVRGGKIMQHINERFGEAAVVCLLYLLVLGHASVDEISLSSSHAQKSERYVTDTPQVNGDGQNARNVRGDINNSERQVRKAVKTLIRNGYVVRLFHRDFQSEEDVKRDAERAVRRQHFPGDIKGQKDQLYFQREIRRLRRSWRDQGRDFEEIGQNGISTKRSCMISDDSSRKRRRLMNSTSGIDKSEISSDPEESTHIKVCSCMRLGIL